MTPDLPRHPSSGFRTFVWALFFFLIFALLIVGVVRWTGKDQSLNDPRSAGRLKVREERDKDDREKLTSPGWVDQANGIVRLPIAEAKRLVIADLKAKKPAPSSVAIEPLLPMPVLDPNALEPPPPPLPSAPQGSDTLSLAALTARPPESAPAVPGAPAPSAAPATPPAAPAPSPAAPGTSPAAPVPPAAPPAAPAPQPAAPATPSAVPPTPATASPAPVPATPVVPPPPVKPSSATDANIPARPASPQAAPRPETK